LETQNPEPDHWHKMPPIDLSPKVIDLVPAFLVIWAVFGIAGSMLFTKSMFRLMSLLEIYLAHALIMGFAGGLTAWYFVCYRPGASLGAGLKIRLTGVRWLLIAGVTGAGLGWASVSIMREGNPVLSQANVRSALGWSICIGYVLLGPVGEEAFYRGLVLPVLIRRFGANTALAFLTVGRATWLAVNTDHITYVFVICFLTELSLSLLRHFSRSLLPSILCNWAVTATFYGLILLA